MNSPASAPRATSGDDLRIRWRVIPMTVLLLLTGGFGWWSFAGGGPGQNPPPKGKSSTIHVDGNYTCAICGKPASTEVYRQ